jgi:hypothetical protein
MVAAGVFLAAKVSAHLVRLQQLDNIGMLDCMDRHASRHVQVVVN